jgi:hypothetical protein
MPQCSRLFVLSPYECQELHKSHLQSKHSHSGSMALHSMPASCEPVAMCTPRTYRLPKSTPAKHRPSHEKNTTLKCSNTVHDNTAAAAVPKQIHTWCIFPPASTLMYTLGPAGHDGAPGYCTAAAGRRAVPAGSRRCSSRAAPLHLCQAQITGQQWPLLLSLLRNHWPAGHAGTPLHLHPELLTGQQGPLLSLLLLLLARWCWNAQ